MNNKSDFIRKYILLKKDHLFYITINLKNIDRFIEIFSYKNEKLKNIKEWIKETGSFYSSIKFEIKIYPDGKYNINAYFPNFPDKEADEVFIMLQEFNNQKILNFSNNNDVKFIINVWDKYFYKLYNDIIEFK